MKKVDWQQTLQKCMEDNPRPSMRDILNKARELFPEKMDAADKAAADHGHLAMISKIIKELTDPTDEGNLSQESLDLPGFATLGFIKARDVEGDITVVNYLDSTRPERRSAILERETVVVRIRKWIVDLKIKEVYLNRWTRDDHTTAREALQIRDREEGAA